jgi:hypothetical protein
VDPALLVPESLRTAATSFATASRSVEYAQEEHNLSTAKDTSHKWSAHSLKGSPTEPSSEEPTMITSGSP